jgi:hypothetical protein
VFISNGDFIFPFDALYFWLKHIFVWSFQSGAVNLDGIIRLPGRLIYLIAFQLLGNVGVSYFFLLSSFVIIFFAFYYFAKHFLEIEKRSVRIVLSLLFTFNPIFLGYLAKLGLLVAVAMLPLCLTFLYQAFSKKRFSYLLLYLFALNISLIHPFTFVINLVVSGGYAIYLAINHWQFIRRHIWKFISIFAVAILMNLYFILPVLSLGTINKAALSQDISSVPIDYTALVEIANTDNIFTALSLSKNVLIDFQFYTDGYQIIYFAAIFLLYIILITLYLLVYKKLKRSDKLQFFIWMIALLTLLVLSTASFFHIDMLIKFLIGLPGGWLFRSPLKWQLYTPLALVVLFALLIRHVKGKPLLWAINGSLVTVIVLGGAILASEIVTKLLVPRSVTHFVALQQVDMQQRSLLFIASDDCMTFAREQPEVMTELNQILISKNTQVKKINYKDIDTTNIGDYEYVLSCGTAKENTQKYLAQFGEPYHFVNDVFRLYKNPAPRPQFYAADQVYALDGTEYINSKASFVERAFNDQFDFVNEKDYSKQTTGLNDIFENVTPRSIVDKTISSVITPNSGGTQRLIVSEQKDPLYYRVDGDDKHVTFSPLPRAGFTLLETHNGFGNFDIQARQDNPVKFDYIDERYNYTNLLQNPSLENGLWHAKVNDCNDYDNNPAVSMSLNSQEKTDGNQSLQLYARRHTACTKLPQQIALEPGATYLLSFDYRSSQPRQAGYNVSFGEAAPSVSETLDEKGGQWHTLNTKITAPLAAAQLDLTVYAFPDEIAGKPATVNYDNFKLIKIPALQGSFHMLGHPSQLKPPKEISYEIANPTKKYIQVKGATTPFYLVMKDSYHSRWQLSLLNKSAGLFGNLPWASPASISEKDHARLNNVMNGWYIDPAQICKKAEYGCSRNVDGSYDIQLKAEFTSQRWFVTGMVISTVTIVGCVIYLFYDRRKQRSASTITGKGRTL